MDNSISEKSCSSKERFTTVSLSPGRSPMKGNLTGSARKVKDSCADWHNYLQKWDKYNAKGMNILTDIANIKLDAVFAKTQALEDNTENIPSATPLQLEEPCSQFLIIYQSLEKVVAKLAAITEALKGVCNLECHQNAGLYDPTPLFQTWTTDKFYETSNLLLGMYEKELQLKKVIVENAAHTKDRNLMMMYTSSWLHQPFIEKKATLLLESMLTETGLR